MSRPSAAVRPLALLLLVLLAAEGLLLLAIVRQRFSFTILEDVTRVEDFDSPLHARLARLDLRIPGVQGGFTDLVREALGTTGDADRERFAAVVRWVARELNPGAGRESGPGSVWSPLDVIRRGREGERFWCDTYARLAASAGQALGLDTRVIWLDGHVVVEALDRDRGRWIAADPTVPALIVDAAEGAPLSFGQAAQHVRDGGHLAYRILAAPREGLDTEATLEFLHKVLGRDLLVYLDGPATVRKAGPDQLLDWLTGRIHGVRLVFPGSTSRATARLGFLGVGAAILILCGAVAVRRRSIPSGP